MTAPVRPASPDMRPDTQRVRVGKFLGSLRHPAVAPILLVAAHPDDEVIGAGAHLAFWPGATVVHVTDGAPVNRPYARDTAFPNRLSYAAARRKESEDALAIAGVPPERIVELGFGDQDAANHLLAIGDRLVALITATRPAIVMTHAYEGGHPDHDATCFAVHAACHIGNGKDPIPPGIVEMSAYFGRDGERVTGAFLPSGETPVVATLDEADRARKRRMLLCHQSQRDLARDFPVTTECFRPAPRYDFRQPPHAGRLFYDSCDFSLTSAAWRALATTALRAFGDPPLL